MDDIFGLLARPAATSTQQAALETFLAALVVDPSLFRIAEHIVGARDLLKLFRVSALVGVVLHGELPVGLPDIRLRSARVHLQSLVEGCGVHGLTAPAEHRYPSGGERPTNLSIQALK